MTNTGWQQTSAVRRYLDQGDPMVMDDEQQDDGGYMPEMYANAPPQAPGAYMPGMYTDAGPAGPPPASIPTPPPAPIAASGDASPDAPVAYRGTQAPPQPLDDYSRSIEAYKRGIADAPKMNKPNWLERIAAGAAGGAAGWSNAAGRIKHPIDIPAMQQNILHPGYAQDVERWKSQMAPLEAQMNVEGQRVTAQQNVAKTQAQINADNARAEYERGQMITVTPEMSVASGGRYSVNSKIPVSVANALDRMVVVTPQMETDSDGHYKAGTAIPERIANTIERKVRVNQAMSDASGGLYDVGALISATEGRGLIDAALKRPSAEKTIKATDEAFARKYLHQPVGTDVPYSIYQAAVTAEARDNAPRSENQWQSLLKLTNGDVAMAMKLQEQHDINVADGRRDPFTDWLKKKTIEDGVGKWKQDEEDKAHAQLNSQIRLYTDQLGKATSDEQKAILQGNIQRVRGEAVARLQGIQNEYNRRWQGLGYHADDYKVALDDKGNVTYQLREGAQSTAPPPAAAPHPAVDLKVKAYADTYFGGDVGKAMAKIAADKAARTR